MGWLSDYAATRDAGDYEELSEEYKMNQTTVRFLHLRRYQPVVGHVSEKEPDGGESYVVGLSLSPYGGVTVAYRDLGDGDFQVALGRCRTDERYERALGRQAAINNLLSPKVTEIVHIPELVKSLVIPDLVAYAKRHARRSLAMPKRIAHVHTERA